MSFSRSSFLRSGFRSSSFRPHIARAQPQAFRQGLRRGYATEGSHKKGSDLPWAIGSIAFTIPAAGYLLASGPDTPAHVVPPPAGEKQDVPSPEKKGTWADLEKAQDEGDDDEGKEESSNDEGDDSSKADSGEDKPKEDKKDEDKPQEEGEKSDDEGPEKTKGVASAGGQPSEKHEGSSKVERKPTDPTSGAQHPDLDSDEKSKKGEGVKETAKIHGTVDSERPSR